jgi:hypothetical protein
MALVRLSVTLVCLALVPPGVAADLRLPAVDGQITGDISPLKIPGAPKLHWMVTLRTDAATGNRTADLDLSGPGTRVMGSGRVTPASDIDWRIVRAQLELATWNAALTTTVPKNLAARGQLNLAGTGTWRDGHLTGTAALDLRDAALHAADDSWSVDGISATGRLADLVSFASDGPIRIAFHEAAMTGIAIGEGAIDLTMDPQRVVHVTQANVALMNGHVALAPFSFPLAKPEVKTTLEFAGVELGGLARFLPSILASAQGPVSGRVDMSWSAGQGLQFANGLLQPRPNETASIRLAPSPGFLTKALPARLREKIDLLPAWLGPVRRWFIADNPAYDTLHAIEMGTLPLEVKTLEVHLQPAGDANGRTAEIVVMARPAAQTSAVESVRFEIHVTGPLADLVRLGLEGKVAVHMK